MFLAELFPYAHVVFIIFTILYALTILGSIGIVISENRNPVKSLSWVTVLILLPIVGLFLYLFFGRSLKSVVMISRKNRLVQVAIHLKAKSRVFFSLPKYRLYKKRSVLSQTDRSCIKVQN